MTDKKSVIPGERIEKRIYCVRQQKVMLSTDLAALYEVEPRVLVQAVKCNIERFPEDFMFQLSEKEFADLKSQFVISSWGGCNSRGMLVCRSLFILALVNSYLWCILPK